MHGSERSRAGILNAAQAYMIFYLTQYQCSVYYKAKSNYDSI